MSEENNIRVMRILQPTYDVEPTLDRRFTKNKMEADCTPIVKEYLTGKSWSDEKEVNTEMSETITNLVMEKVREANLDRYKIIVHTNIGENRNQTVRVASHCLWESTLDSAAEINFISEQLWCT
eukprot:CAMPEP_0203752124 /NCGR_PEP_ID=MMETSP0098-20131031/6090_1 /ASSEMBLY_ACC=CAM_ASM_000208 /TAXON_ID=96639 /ORGANISM=" , Strain NY0313808BC1" /LENGTH=123 /DNA_ID=CAMNT_0050642139 /DNA_START=102 /DNA_END=469 /DNA_ORIENTATION=-